MQAVAGEQGMIGAGVPPGQKLKTGHSMTFVGKVEPAGQPYPEEAVQFPLQAGNERPELLP